MGATNGPSTAGDAGSGGGFDSSSGGSQGGQSGHSSGAQGSAGSVQGGQSHQAAPTLNPQTQAQFDALMANPQFKSWYQSQKAGEAPVPPAQTQAYSLSPEVQTILDQMLPAPKEVAINDPSRQLTGQQLLDFQRQINQRQRVMNFQSDIRGLFDKPVTVDGVTIDMSNPQKAQGFLNFVRDFVNRPPTAKELVTLHFIGDLISGARDSAGRRAESALQRSSVRGNADATEQARVVTPQPQPNNRSAANPNKVPSLLDMVAQDEGVSADQWMNQWNRKSLLG